MYGKNGLVIILIVLLLLSVYHYIVQQVEKPKIERFIVEKPLIPESINRGPNIEPKLNVYIVQDKEVKEMNIEEYVTAVVAGEMPTSWPEEALAAQAILARTYVLEFITHKGSSRYDTNAHVSTDYAEAQAWDNEAVTERLKRIVNSTRGMVVSHEGNLIKAWFHSHAGGITSLSQEGLSYKGEEPPYIKVVESPDFVIPELSNWHSTFTKGEIITAVKKLGINISDFDTMEVYERGPSGRAVELKLGEVIVPAPEFRISVGSIKLKSTLIDEISLAGNLITIKGRGFGHGVGMSQWGAYQMAIDGKKSEDIIKYYYEDVEIVKLWE